LHQARSVETSCSVCHSLGPCSSFCSHNLITCYDSSFIPLWAECVVCYWQWPKCWIRFKAPVPGIINI
jgi:hypothetical protein